MKYTSLKNMLAAALIDAIDIREENETEAINSIINKIEECKIEFNKLKNK